MVFRAPPLHAAGFAILFCVCGCFNEPPPAAEGDDASTGSETSGGDATTGEPSSTGLAETGSSGGGSGEEGSSETGDAGYPAEVLDALDLPFPPANYANPELPDAFTEPGVRELINTPDDNPITDDGATLGRVLFYDVELSVNRTVSCASCHDQSRGFSDPRRFSEGFDGEVTGRNSMSIINARYYVSGHAFWDERADTLEEQALAPIQDPIEMGMDLDDLIVRLEGSAFYRPLFERAFGDSAITSDRIGAALAQFVRSVISTQTRFDAGLAAAGNPMAPFDTLSAEENMGKDLFFGPAGNCAVCHVGRAGGGPPGPPGAGDNASVFMMVTAANNGLDPGPTESDNGVGDATSDPLDNGLFKVPTLRSIALTGPYMHDGRFETLMQVIEHYDNGVQAHPNLDMRLGGPQNPQQLGLDPAQKQALVAFLEALTDDAIAEDPKFSDPFL